MYETVMEMVDRVLGYYSDSCCGDEVKAKPVSDGWPWFRLWSDFAQL